MKPMLKTLTLASLLAISLPALAVTSASPSFAASALCEPRPGSRWNGRPRRGRKTAAAALFDKLEQDHDGTLDAKELHGRLSAKEWAVAEPDNDKTISKDEYLAYVEVLFKQADPDNDGTLDAKELKSPAGHALLRLLK